MSFNFAGKSENNKAVGIMLLRPDLSFEDARSLIGGRMTIKDKPDRDGYYWFREVRTKRVSIVHVTGNQAKHCDAKMATNVEKFQGEWWGPLECPFERRKK